MALIRESLVGLWSHPHDVQPERFVCSGVFVDSGLILTAKHVFKEYDALWVRPRSNAAKSFPITQSPWTVDDMAHRDLDAALARIEAMPYESVPAPLDHNGNANDIPDGLTLNGCFQGHFEPPMRVMLTGFDPELRHHITDVRQPVGHSGSGLANKHQLWGITFAHYLSPNIHRGCAHSIHQLWKGWLERYLDGRGREPLAAEVPSHHVDERGKEIRMLIGLGDLDQAKNRLLDFVNEFGTKEDIDSATLLAMELRLVHEQLRSLDIRQRITAVKKFQVPLAHQMLALLNALLQRLRGRFGPGDPHDRQTP